MTQPLRCGPSCHRSAATSPVTPHAATQNHPIDPETCTPAPGYTAIEPLSCGPCCHGSDATSPMTPHAATQNHPIDPEPRTPAPGYTASQPLGCGPCCHGSAGSSPMMLHTLPTRHHTYCMPCTPPRAAQNICKHASHSLAPRTCPTILIHAVHWIPPTRKSSMHHGAHCTSKGSLLAGTHGITTRHTATVHRC